MNVGGLGIANGSLASLFGANSREAWVQMLLERRKCMDCKEPLAADEGTMEFCGQLPLLELIGHRCSPFVGHSLGSPRSIFIGVAEGSPEASTSTIPTPMAVSRRYVRIPRRTGYCVPNNQWPLRVLYDSVGKVGEVELEGSGAVVEPSTKAADWGFQTLDGWRPRASVLSRRGTDAPTLIASKGFCIS
jgi:hypothetical protein